MGKQRRGLVNKTIAERLLIHNMEQTKVVAEGMAKSSVWRVAKRMIEDGMAPEDFVVKRKSHKKKDLDIGTQALQDNEAQYQELVEQEEANKAEKEEERAEREAEKAEKEAEKAEKNGVSKRDIRLAAISARKISTVFRIANDEIVLDPDALFETYFLYKNLVVITGAENSFSDMLKAGMEVLWSLAQKPPEVEEEVEPVLEPVLEPMLEPVAA